MMTEPTEDLTSVSDEELEARIVEAYNLAFKLKLQVINLSRNIGHNAEQTQQARTEAEKKQIYWRKLQKEQNDRQYHRDSGK